MHQRRDPVLYSEERRRADTGVPLEIPGRMRLVVVPVQRGQRRLSIRGTTGGGFSVDVFYTLNVVSLKLKD